MEGRREGEEGEVGGFKYPRMPVHVKERMSHW